MKKPLLLASLILILLSIFTTCKEELPIVEPFDRKKMLENWADQMILPAQKAFNTTTKTLHTQAQTFVNAPSLANLEAIREAWLASYLAWQHVPYFTPQPREGPIKYEELDEIALLYFGTNVYPTDTQSVKEFINSADFNASIRQQNVQGLPALEYLLYGLAPTDNGILAYYKETALDAEKHQQYLLFLTDRLQSVSDAALSKWANGYRDKFVSNIIQETNDCARKLIVDYADFFIAEIVSRKLGAPIGHPSLICGSCDYIPPNKFLVEGTFSRIHSKTLLLESLNAAQDFYNGVPFGSTCGEGSRSIYQYLYNLQALDIKTGEKLYDLINNKFDLARAEIELLGDDLGYEAENNKKQVYDVYLLMVENWTTLYWGMEDALGLHDSYNFNRKRFFCP